MKTSTNLQIWGHVFFWRQNGGVPTLCQDELLIQVEEFKHLMVLFVNEGWGEQETDRQTGAYVSVCCSEERAEHESNAINLQVSLDSYYHLWSRAPASEQKNEASSGNKFPLKGVRHSILILNV